MAPEAGPKAGFDDFYRRSWSDAGKWSTALTGRPAIGQELAQDAFSDDELIAVLAEPRLDTGTWTWPGAATAGLAEVPDTPRPPFEARSVQVVQADGQRVTIVAQTAIRWDLLQQSTTFSPLTGWPATAVLPSGTIAVVRADPAATTSSGSRAAPSCT